MGAHPVLVPDSFDGQISFTISNYLRKLKKQVSPSHFSLPKKTVIGLCMKGLHNFVVDARHLSAQVHVDEQTLLCDVIWLACSQRKI